MALFINRAEELSETLSRAVAAEDWKLVQETAHTLKGSGSSFGFPELTEMARRVCDLIELGQESQRLEQTAALQQKLEQIIER